MMSVKAAIVTRPTKYVALITRMLGSVPVVQRWWWTIIFTTVVAPTLHEDIRVEPADISCATVRVIARCCP